MAEVFLNGRFVDRDDASVGAFDAAVQHGVGLFETMMGTTAEDGTPAIARLERHLERLTTSARELGLARELNAEPIAEAAIETLKRSGLARSRVRLTVTGGDLNLLETGGKSQHRPTILIAATPAAAYPDEMFERGVAVTIADARANPLDPTAGHKTLNYWWRLRELQAAAGKGAGEAIVLQVTNHLCGGCVSNVFLVKEGRLLTPIARGEEEMVGGKGTLPSPVLPGITRRAVIEAAQAEGVEVERRMLGVNDLLDADELFVTNSSFGVLPVVKAEAEAIGDGVVGGVTKRVRAWVNA
ncbi:MAG: branched chain amino acid aminotransferase [Phycisphaeraceae bacterium]|nr:MAG: branched chain amino acid aminotransferase [Phycisphaeraceae bacterium]